MGDQREDVYEYGGEYRTPSGFWKTVLEDLFDNSGIHLVPGHAAFALPEEFLR